MRADAISAKGKEKLKGQDIIPALSYQCSNFLKGFKCLYIFQILYFC